MSTTSHDVPEDHRFADLDRRVAEEMERLRIPGVAVGVHVDGQEYLAGYGVTSIDNPLPVTADTLFQIGSTTKTITATAAMRLVEQGKLQLDAPVRTYLPELRLSDESVAARVTMWHLFTHTGGWVGDYFNDFGGGDDALAGIVASLESLPQLTPLGETFSYSNSGFYIAGRVIEAITGRTFESAIAELVLDPLGMNMSFFFPGDIMTYRFAVGHNQRDGNVVVARPWPIPRAAHPAGGIASNVMDQLRYARFHMDGGRTSRGVALLKPETIALMQSPQVPTGAANEYRGITWMLRSKGGVNIVEHGGGTNGHLSAFLMIPDRHFAITVLTNADAGSQLNTEIVNWALERYCHIADPEPTLREMPADQLIAYTGRYSAAAHDIDIIASDGTLVLLEIPKGGFPTVDSPPPPADPPVRLAFVDDDHVLALDPPIQGRGADFLRDAEGRVIWLRLGGRLHKRI